MTLGNKLLSFRALIVFAHDLDNARPQLRYLINLLRSWNVEVDLVGPITNRTHIPGLRIVPVTSGAGRWSTLATIWRGFCRAWRGEYRLIIGFDEPGTIATWPVLVWNRSRKSVLYYLEFFDDQRGSHSQKLGRLVMRRYGHRATLVVEVNKERAARRKVNFASHATQALVHNAPPIKLDLGTEKDPFLSSFGPDKIKVIYVGAITDRVYLELAIAAMRLLPEHIVFFIVGNDKGEYCTHLKNLAVKSGCSQRVVFTGLVPRERLASIYSGADIGLALYGTKPPTEQNEIFCSPNKVYEYMAAGLPVVCSENTTLKSLVEAHEWGVCVPVDEPKSLAQAIHRMASDPQARQRMSQRARDFHLTRMNFECQAGPLVSLLKTISNCEHQPRAHYAAD